MGREQIFCISVNELYQVTNSQIKENFKLYGNPLNNEYSYNNAQQPLHLSSMYNKGIVGCVLAPHEVAQKPTFLDQNQNSILVTSYAIPLHL